MPWNLIDESVNLRLNNSIKSLETTHVSARL